MAAAAKRSCALFMSVVLAMGLCPAFAHAEGLAAGSAAVLSDTQVADSVTDYNAELTFADSGITAGDEGSGYKVKGTALTINEPGIYRITGSCSDGSIAVKKGTTGVTLVLADLLLASSATAPLAVNKDNGDTVVQVVGEVVLIDKEDAASEETNEDFEGAAIKVKSGSNLSIIGSGSLVADGSACKNGVKGASGTVVTIGESASDTLSVTAKAANNGIASDGSVAIKGGTVAVEAGNEGIKSKPDSGDTTSAGSISISGGTVEVTASGDAIQAAGDIDIAGGAFKLVAGCDGIQAGGNLSIAGGSFDVATCGGAASTTFNGDASSAKGLKANASDDESSDTSGATNTITVTGGDFTFDTADDAIHSDGYAVITGGEFNIKTGDDAVHADTSLTLGEQGGSDSAIHMTVQRCYEGLESGSVYLYSGCYDVTASDDGINAAGGKDGSGSAGPGQGDGFSRGGRPGAPGNFGPTTGAASSADYSLDIAGGLVSIKAGGDGVDSNGALTISGGTVVSWASGNDKSDNALDADGTFSLTGGTVFGVGYNNPAAATPKSATQSYKGWASAGSISKGQTVAVTQNGSTVVSLASPFAYTNAYWFYSSPTMASSSSCSFKTTSAAAAGVPSTWVEAGSGSGSESGDASTGSTTGDTTGDTTGSAADDTTGDTTGSAADDTTGGTAGGTADDTTNDTTNDTTGGTTSGTTGGTTSSAADSSASDTANDTAADASSKAGGAISIANAKVSAIAARTYTGKALKPKPTVTVGGVTLKLGEDYTLAYKNNKKSGKATVVIKGVGDYTGTISRTFIIKPAKVTGLKVVSTGAGKVKVSWTKSKAVAAGVTGYQVYYKVAGKAAKTVLVKKASTATKLISKLAKGKKVTVKVRAYKTVGSTKRYSAWSAAKSVKIAS